MPSAQPGGPPPDRASNVSLSWFLPGVWSPFGFPAILRDGAVPDHFSRRRRQLRTASNSRKPPAALNPMTASALAAVMLGEPIGLNLVIGIAAVLIGIRIASTELKPSYDLDQLEASPLRRDIGLFDDKPRPPHEMVASLHLRCRLPF